MKTNITIAFSLAVWIGVLFAFSTCQRNDKAERDSTNSAGTSVTKHKVHVPTEYEPTNNTTASKKHKRDTSSIYDRTNSSRDDIDFNSTRSGRQHTTATNGTRPGPVPSKTVQPIRKMNRSNLRHHGNK